MGEIADDMCEGRCCSWCNVYFQKEHGYPVACENCWDEYENSWVAVLEVVELMENHPQLYRQVGVKKAIHKEL